MSANSPSPLTISQAEFLALGGKSQLKCGSVAMESFAAPTKTLQSEKFCQ